MASWLRTLAVMNGRRNAYFARLDRERREREQRERDGFERSRHDPLVGGESARRIVEIVRKFPLSVSSGRVVIENNATGEDLELFNRAYARVEFEVMESEVNCSHRHEHRSLTSDDFYDIVLHVLMEDALDALGIDRTADPIWH